MEKKISIIVPVYGTEKYLEKCIQSVIHQTYRNKEMILVNDCTPDHSQAIIDAYVEQYDWIRCVKLERNKGLFHARLAGLDVATGDYIAFLDSDDYVAEDAYRTLIQKAEKTQSDIAFGKIVIEWEADGRQETHSYNEPLFDILQGDQILDTYLGQEGYTFFWYAVWNKIFTRKIVDEARPYFDRITEHTIMAEDVAFCSVFLAMADRIACSDYYTNYYLQSSTSSTSRSANPAKYIKNVEDMCRVMTFVEDFVGEHPAYEGIRHKFDRFKEVFVLYWKTSIYGARFGKRKKNECYAALKKHAKITAFPDHDRAGQRSMTYGVDRSFIYNQLASFDNRYEQIIKQISCETTSSIVFPFEEILFQKNIMDNKDFFWFLEQDFVSLCPNGLADDYFSRRLSYEGTNVIISLEGIYQEMSQAGLDKSLCEILKEGEIALVKRLYTPRKSMKQLFDLAVYLNKRVIIQVVSRLNDSIVKDMLLEHGYQGDYDIWFEGHADFKSDRAESPVLIFKRETEVKRQADRNWIEILYPRAVEVLLNQCGMFDYFGKSDWSEKNFFGNMLNKVSVMTAANLYFDNPFRPFDKKTDFNRDVYLMGLLPIAMHMMNMTRWLMDQKQYEEFLYSKSNRFFMEIFQAWSTGMDAKPLWKQVKEVDFAGMGEGKNGKLQSVYFGVSKKLTDQADDIDTLWMYGDAGEWSKRSNAAFLFLDKSLPQVVEYLLGSADEASLSFYSERLINYSMRSGVRDFTERMISVYSTYLTKMECDGLSTAYPFEYLLYRPKFKDIGVFDYCSLYFEKNKGLEEMSLFNYWMQVNVSKADIISGKVELEGGIGYYPFLQNRSPIVKALFFLLFDNETLFEKLKIRFGADKRSYKLVKRLETLVMNGKDGESNEQTS